MTAASLLVRWIVSDAGFRQAARRRERPDPQNRQELLLDVHLRAPLGQEVVERILSMVALRIGERNGTGIVPRRVDRIQPLTRSRKICAPVTVKAEQVVRSSERQ